MKLIILEALFLMVRQLNLSMIENLGAKIGNIDMEPSFDHPVTEEPIFPAC